MHVLYFYVLHHIGYGSSSVPTGEYDMSPLSSNIIVSQRQYEYIDMECTKLLRVCH